MYAVRRWSVRHSRGLETFYNGFERVLLWLEPVIRRVGYGRLEKPVAWLEEKVKGFLFDCQMCGQCALSRTGMSCPMNCPKQLRNGPCGGVRANGNCEVKPDMKCVWVEAWNGSRQMRHGSQIHNVEVAVDRRLEGASSWLRVVRIKTEEKRQERADGEKAA
jgi:hypothetical protein